MLQHLDLDVTDEALNQWKNWRQRRPEWKRYIAILSDKSATREAICLAAANALASRNESTELQSLITRCRSNGPEASRLEGCERSIEAAKKALAMAQARLRERGLSVEEQEAARLAAAASEQALIKAECEVQGPRQETAIRVEGRAFGIIDD